MTEPLPEVSAEERHELLSGLAQELQLLDMAGDWLAGEQTRLRTSLAEMGVGGDSWEHSAVNTDGELLKAGTVRVDPGPVTVRITSDAEFQAWVGRMYPARLVVQPEGSTARPEPDGHEMTALDSAAATWADSQRFGGDYLQDAWDMLLQCGYQLVEVEKVPARTVVDPAFQDRVFKAAKAAKAPVDHNDEPVEGLEVKMGARRVVVTPVKDPAITRAFVKQSRDQLLAALAPGESEEE